MGNSWKNSAFIVLAGGVAYGAGEFVEHWKSSTSPAGGTEAEDASRSRAGVSGVTVDSATRAAAQMPTDAGALYSLVRSDAGLPKSFEDPRIIKLLAENCHSVPSSPDDKDPIPYAEDEGGPGADQERWGNLSCSAFTGCQNCNGNFHDDPCYSDTSAEVFRCQKACENTCGQCVIAATSTCTTCKSACKPDDASCFLNCGAATARHRSRCLVENDHCSTADCVKAVLATDQKKVAACRAKLPSGARGKYGPPTEDDPSGKTGH